MHLPYMKGVNVRNEDKAALLELFDDELAQHYYRVGPGTQYAPQGTYETRDAASRQLVERALNFVLGDHYDESEFALKPADRRYDRIDQGRLAILATYLLDNREVFGLTPEMRENARHLKHHVADNCVPVSIVRPRA